MTDQSHDDSGIGEGTPQGDDTDVIHGQGGEGREKQAATPPLKEQGVPGQTQVPAPPDDVGGQRGGEDRPSE